MRRAILLKRWGFPALQPYFERGIPQKAQPGCDYFSCISCTTAAPNGIKCCSDMARSPIAPWFALSITFSLISRRTHYFSASKMNATRLRSLKRGHITTASIKNQITIQKNLCKWTFKMARFVDLALYCGQPHEPADEKKRAQGRAFLSETSADCQAGRPSPRGSGNAMFSSMPSSARTLRTPTSSRNRPMTACASTSGAEAPAVTPIRRLPSTQTGSI
jgi:hypothetical protein